MGINNISALFPYETVDVVAPQPEDTVAITEPLSEPL